MTYIAGNDSWYGPRTTKRSITANEAIDEGFLVVNSSGDARGGDQIEVETHGYVAYNNSMISPPPQFDIHNWVGYGHDTAKNSLNQNVEPLEESSAIIQLPSSYTRACLFLKPIRDFYEVDGQFAGTIMSDLYGLYVMYYEGDYVSGQERELPAREYHCASETSCNYKWFYNVIDPAQGYFINILTPAALGNIAAVGNAGSSFYDTSPNEMNEMCTIYTPLSITYHGIRFFRTRDEAVAYLANPSPTPDPGDDFMDELRNNINIENKLSSVLKLPPTTFNNFADVLYPADETALDTLCEGLKMYGENPVNFIVDAFYLPFNPDPFISAQRAATSTNFGSNEYRIGDHTVIQKLNHKVIGSYEIVGQYNDFRDYLTTNLYIFLPFSGWYQLNTEKYMYKTLTVKCFFDVRTGVIKYYIFAGNSVADMFQGGIKTSMPVAGSNRSEGSRNIMSSIGQTVGNVGASIASGSALKTAGSLFAGWMDLSHQKAPKTVSGSFSAESALMDPLKVNLAIERTDCVYPANVAATYGLPDNKVGTIGSNSGFVAVSDVILNSTQTQARRNRIIEKLKQGVIV